MYWNRPMETIDRESLERIQLERLQKTVHRMYTNVAFYRERMQKQGVKPEDIQSLSDLKLLPFMDKRDLRDNYPDGTFAAPRSEIVRIHASSGTTGKPIVAGYTRGDLAAPASRVRIPSRSPTATVCLPAALGSTTAWRRSAPPSSPPPPATPSASSCSCRTLAATPWPAPPPTP